MTYSTALDVYRTAKVPGGNTSTPLNPYSGLFAQIDNASPQLAQSVVGAGMNITPYDVYSIYIYYAATPNAIQRGDTLKDNNTPDPLNNNKPTEYVVIGNPESFPDGHIELYAGRVDGT